MPDRFETIVFFAPYIFLHVRGAFVKLPSSLKLRTGHQLFSTRASTFFIALSQELLHSSQPSYSIERKPS